MKLMVLITMVMLLGLFFSWTASQCFISAAHALQTIKQLQGSR